MQTKGQKMSTEKCLPEKFGQLTENWGNLFCAL